MTAITIFLTFLLLMLILAAGLWGGYLLHRRLSLLEGEYRRIRLSAVEDVQQLDQKIQEMGTRIESAESRLNDAGQRPGSSVNYTQRSQMLRKIRRGETAEQISSTLGVPVSQVRLLMKLPGIAAAAPSKEQTAGQLNV